MVNIKNLEKIVSELKLFDAILVAVSKNKSMDDIKLLLNLGQKAFGENYEQELTNKNNILPDVDWHFIGHLQSNKVHSIVSIVKLIHSTDSIKLLEEINKQSEKLNRVQDCLLQIHIAKEETKFGFSIEEADKLLSSDKLNTLKYISVKGLMGMASASDDKNIIQNEFRMLGKFFNKNKNTGFDILSMGMTSDYKIALEEGSTMVRIGSAIFGERSK